MGKTVPRKTLVMMSQVNHNLDFLARVEGVARRHYPKVSGPGGIHIMRCSQKDFYHELAEHFEKIEGVAYVDFLAHLPPEDAALRRQGVSLRHCEYQIAYAENGEAVAFLAGEMLNEETFHLRWLGVVAPKQRQGISRQMIAALMPFLCEVGYDKVNALHAHTNLRSIQTALSFGFFLCGMEQSERFGVLVQSLYCFDPARERQHAMRFGHTVEVPSVPNPSKFSDRELIRPHDRLRLLAALGANMQPRAFIATPDGTWIELEPRCSDGVGEV